MGQFKYQGLDEKGKRVEGKVDASGPREAKRFLRNKGIKVRRIQSPSILEFDINIWLVDNGLAAPFSVSDLALFTKQLSIMINAGVPILQSLEILFKTQKNTVLKQTIKNISNDVSEGKTISDSLESKSGFSKFYINLVRAGEVAGILDTILIKLNEQMEKQEKLKKQLKSAMTYPAIVCLVGIAVVYAMMVFVVPQFVDMLESSGQTPPFITRLVVGISNYISKNSILLMGGIVGTFLFFKSLISVKAGKKLFDKYIMLVPLIGPLVVKANLASFSRTFATMLSSGIPIIESLETCIQTLENTVIAADLTKVKNNIVMGKSLSDQLSKINYFPEMVTSMIKVGEQTGNIDLMLIKISEVFEDDVDELMGNLTKMIEPLIIVVLGGIVATILVAMYLPIFMSAGGNMD